MIDPNLTREKALADIASPQGVVLLNSVVEKEIITLCRNASEARNHCFASEGNYRENFASFKNFPKTLVQKLAQSEPFQFLSKNFNIYANAGELQQQFKEALFYVTFGNLIEVMSNSMAASDDVQTSVHITPKGLLLDVEQGIEGMGTDFLDDIRRKSEMVYAMLKEDSRIQEMISRVKALARTAIGFVPPELENTLDAYPYRGNGIANILVDNFHRTNFINDGASSRTISFHDLKQLIHVGRFHLGYHNAIHDLYGPSDVPLDKTALDGLFASGFDLKDLLK